MSDKNFRVRHGLEVDGSATLAGDLQVDGNDIKGSGGVTAITMNTGRVILADDLTITGNTVTLAQGTDIFYSENNSRLNRPNIQSTTGDSTGLRVAAPNTTTNASAVVSAFNTNDPLNGKFINLQARGSTTNPLRIATGEYTAGVFAATGDQIDIVDGTTVYATLNPAGVINGTDLTTKTYVDAHPGTTYDIDATAATGGANLNLNGSDSTTDTVKFSGSGGTTVTQTSANEITISSTAGTTYDIDATSATGGANLNLNGSDATTDTVKFTGGTNITVTATSATEITIDGTDLNTTYTIDASSTTGGANLNLVGSDSTTDTVKFASGTGVTVSQTSANEMSIAIGQAVGTGDSPSFLGVTAGNLTVGVATDNTIASTDTNGNIVLAPNGTGDVQVDADTLRVGDSNATATITTNGTGNLVLNTNAGTNAGTITLAQGTNGNITVAPNGTGLLVVSTATDTDLVDNTRVLGLLESTTNTNGAYTFPAQFLATVTSGSGVTSASSVGGLDGYAAGSVMTHYFADTRAGSNTAPAFTFQGANGNSNPSATIPWTGVAGTAVSAQSANGIMGALNFSTYATTDWASYISGMNQGGGFNVTHPLQIQGYLAEAPADGTLTISGATITAVSRVSVAFANVQVTGTRGQISFNATTPAVGNAVAVTGTNSGTSTGIVAGTYYVIATNGSTTAQLSATPGGYPITTTAGTTTGLTFTRQFITVTYSAQTNIPFGLNAKIAISGFTNVTSGTYMAQGTSTTTQVLIGAPSSGVPALSGSQSLSTPTVTNAGAGFRVRGMGAATPMNSGNRVNFIDHTAASATYRADSFVVAGGAYGGTGGTYLTLNNTDATFTKPIKWSGSTSGTVQISAPAVAGTQTYTLPTAQPTANNQVLVSTTGGVMSWVSTNSLAANYLDAEWVTAIGALTANTIYGLPVASISATNITIATGAIAIDNATATGPTRITFSQTGRYNLQFSIQLVNTDSAEQDFDLWLRKNTVDVADSNTQITVVKQQGGIPGKNIMALNLLLNVTSVGDYYELVYATTNAGCKPETIAAITTPYVRPRTPAVILTVVPVGA